ncbi:hypothetical protein J6590_024111 [Homalodisca vitripennis]|nr:hypothetical protein J6590_024111 [Homalodisca vitripennis]
MPALTATLYSLCTADDVFQLPVLKVSKLFAFQCSAHLNVKLECELTLSVSCISELLGRGLLYTNMCGRLGRVEEIDVREYDISTMLIPQQDRVDNMEVEEVFLGQNVEEPVARVEYRPISQSTG